MKHVATLIPVFCAAAFVLSLAVLPVAAQGSLTLPPSGGNQKSVVTQYLGPVEVTITYNSPDVNGREGQIWGQLVPYGLVQNTFGTASKMPWRAGANENTTFSVSHDVEVEGRPLPAGTYGLHMIPGEAEWVVIFSENASSWGSFFYDEEEDALRVTVEPEAAPFTEYLTYTFTERKLDTATVALEWENLRVPFQIAVPNVDEIYLARIRDELRSSAGFSWQNWNAAAQFALNRNTNLEEALVWAESAISAPFIGQENFTTLSTKARLLTAVGRTEEADDLMARAMTHPTATVLQIHNYGRQLIAQGRVDEAMEVFRYNAERFEDTWPTDWGLARGYAAAGDFRRALRHARIALERAPDDLNRDNIQALIPRLEAGEDIN